ncbi:MAG: ABC transporter permease, partial [Paludibacteraceae bacterium]|nr:ABC transporter permease [Paludibacteraceae bacterium]
MNLELFIARKVHNGSGKNNMSRPAVIIATTGIALGIAVMLLSVAIVIGFKHQIRDKVIAFGSHIQVSNYDNNQTYETKAITVSDSLLQELRNTPNVRHTQRYATKPGIIKTENDVQGIILKGIDPNFDWEFYRPNIIEGDTITPSKETAEDDFLPPPASKEALISQYLSRLLNLKVGDTFFIYFVQEDGIRARKLTVKGIYCTNVEEYDKQFILADIKQIQQINNWNEQQASGIEILVDDYSKLDETTDKIYFKTANKISENGETLLPRNIEELNPQIFSWLSMLDINVVIILTLMLTVASFNMISGLLIIILEKTNMIGILKALGAKNWNIRKIFLYQSAFLIGKGLLWG